MTVKSCIIGFGFLIIVWLGVAAAHVGVSTSQAVSVALSGS
jgi:hypothetical protein